MNLNNKGFAITSIIYSMLILFLTLVVLIIGNLASRKAVFDKQKEDLLNKFEQEDTETSLLPKGYQVVEYITSDGKAWIDTGFVANQDTRVVVDFKYDVVESKFLFGCRSNVSSRAYTVNVSNSSGVTSYGNSGNKGYKKADEERHIIDKNKAGFKLDNEEIDIGLTDAQKQQTFSCPGNLEIFATLNGSTKGYYASKSIIYSFQIYDNDTLIRDYVPCYKSASSEYGLCDLVTENSEEIFYGNAASSGSFTGPAINS